MGGCTVNAAVWAGHPTTMTSCSLHVDHLWLSGLVSVDFKERLQIKDFQKKGVQCAVRNYSVWESDSSSFFSRSHDLTSQRELAAFPDQARLPSR